MLSSSSSALFFLLLVALNCSVFVSCLECYVCLDQEDNEGKCSKTVQLCGREELHCLSIIKWGSMPYWTQGAPKQYFISKMCATREVCDHWKKKTSPRCERIGYNDWECSECCQGDRCNYFITLGSSSLKCNWLMPVVSIAFLTLLWRRP